MPLQPAFNFFTASSNGSRALYSYVNSDLAVLVPRIFPIGAVVRFYDIGNGLPVSLQENVDFYVQSVGNYWCITNVLNGAPLYHTTCGAFRFEVFPSSFGDTCLKPKLLKEQKARLFPKTPSLLQTPPPARKILKDFAYDGQTGLMMPAGETTEIF